MLETERCHNVAENRKCFVKDKSHNINLITFGRHNFKPVVMPEAETGYARFSENSIYAVKLLLEAILTISDHQGNFK